MSDAPAECCWGWPNYGDHYPSGCICNREHGHPGKCICDCGNKRQRPARWDTTREAMDWTAAREAKARNWAGSLPERSLPERTEP